MLIHVMGDLHLGAVPPFSNRVTARRFHQYRKAHLLSLLSRGGSSLNVCTGDFFHRTSAWDSTFTQATMYARNFDFILGGNHDLSKDTSKTPALSHMRELLASEKGVRTRVIKASEVYEPEDKVCLTFVPYQLLQEDFIQELDRVRDWTPARSDVPNLLFLHCQVGEPIGFAPDHENYLPMDKARELLEVFDYILVGHEHNYRTYENGRIITLGSVLPFAFDEMHTKYTHTFDTETRTWARHTVWNSKSFSSVNFKTFLECPEGFSHLQFLELTGTTTPSEQVKLVQALTGFYKTSTRLFSLKNNTRPESSFMEWGERVKPEESWKDILKQGLTEDELQLFTELEEENDASC